jgi:hypothetical protein
MDMAHGGRWGVVERREEKKKRKYVSCNHITPYGLELKLMGDVENQF